MLSTRPSPLAFSPNEELPLGVEFAANLIRSLPSYVEFISWQIPVKVGAGLPSTRAVVAAAHSAALFAAQAQAEDVLPMIDFRFSGSGGAPDAVTMTMQFVLAGLADMTVDLSKIVISLEGTSALLPPPHVLKDVFPPTIGAVCIVSSNYPLHEARTLCPFPIIYAANDELAAAAWSSQHSGNVSIIPDTPGAALPESETLLAAGC